MNKIWMIFQNSMRRSKMILIGALICGLLLCLLYSLIGSMVDHNQSSIPIGIYDKDKTVSSKEFVQYLRGDLKMTVHSEETIDTLNKDLIEKKISAIVEIPSGFEAGLIKQKERPLEIYYTDDYKNSAFINGYLNTYVDSAKTLALAADGSSKTYHRLLRDNKNQKASVTVSSADKDAKIKVVEKNGIDVTIGFFLMVSFIMALGFSSMIFTDRKEGTFSRIKIASVSTPQYMVGMCLSSIVSSMFLILPFLLFVGAKGMHIDLSIGVICFLCTIYALIVVGFSLFVAMIINTKNAIMAGIVGFTTVTCILGGAFFPLDYSPAFLQQLARITPQFWFMDTIDILLNHPNEDWWFNAMILLLFAVLFFVLAGVRFAAARPQTQ